MVAEIGSVSHGTLKDEDLLREFYDLLESLDSDGEYGDLLADAYSLIADVNWDEAIPPDETAEMVGALQDALNEFAPEGCYFGAHISDGANFGFWVLDDE